MNDEELIKDECATFFAAATQTTSTLISNTLFYITMKPEVRAKLIAELRTNLGSEVSKFTQQDWMNKFSYDQINLDNSWNYLMQIIMESLRIEPPIRFTTKQTLIEDQTINGMKIRKGDNIIFPTFFVQRDPKQW